MAVEEYSSFGIEVKQPWQSRAQLINNESVRFKQTDFGSEVCPENEVELSEDCAYDGKSAQDRRRD